MNKGDRVEIKHYEYKGKRGTILSITSNIVFVVKIDGVDIPVATTRDNLKLV